MTTPYLEYELHDGYIDNWLVAGPLEVAVPNTWGEGQPRNEHQRKLDLAREYYTSDPQVVAASPQPVERASFTLEGVELMWNYTRCLDDHFVDLSTFHGLWHYLRAWAYSEINVWEEQEVEFVLTTNGPADVWLNGEHVHRQEHFSHQDPKSVSFTATLQEGWNTVLVRFEEVAARECPYAMALQLRGVDDEDVAVRVPAATEHTARHLMFEQALPYATIEGVANYRGREVNLHWADTLPNRFNYQYSLMESPRDRIHISGKVEAQPGIMLNVGHEFRIWQGPYRVVLHPRPEEYYDYGVRYRWEIPFYILDTAYSEEPYGTYAERNREALEYATTQKGDLYAEIAKMELGKWEELDLEFILKAIARINARADCSDFYLVGLLGALYRYGDTEGFPVTLHTSIRECALNFKYWHDEPGTDAMCYTTENHSILFHACEILAGQLYPDETFTNVGETGAWHRAKGERLAREWLERRGATGFWEWDSNCYFDEDLLALSHLVGLAEDDDVRELAAVVIDKMLFTMAVNSFKGTFGSTHGRTYAQLIKSGQLEATSGIMRLMWGQGVYNQHLRGLVAMACSEYEFPTLIGNVATQPLEEMWDRERHVINPLGDEINKVTYKTPDYMLASVQDYRPGEKGYQQHIWQATFGPDAVVFVTHPPCISQEGAHRPNFWTGNYILPRVAQWKDTLIALYDLPEDDWLGFTHAYFPSYQFDEYAIRGNWAFARKGEGYLALMASQGLELRRHGVDAARDLRSYGQQHVWICQMGRASVDGSFEAFQDQVLDLDVSVEGLQVEFENLRGDTLRFGWEGPLLLNGEEQPLQDFKHYENPYTVTDLHAEQMDIQFGEYVLRLTF